MKSRPILFSGPMVRALLDGSKTQTRRIVKPQPPEYVKDLCSYHHTQPGHWLYGWSKEDSELLDWCIKSPYGGPSDQLWVKETFFAFGRWETRFSAKKGRDEWHFVDMTLECGHAYLYAADQEGPPASIQERRHSGVTPGWWKRPAIFMPRAASRITLEITGVRVERLQDISEADAMAEGSPPGFWEYDNGEGTETAKESYQCLWESINGPGSWDTNPWVWVVEFKVMPK